MPELGLLAAAVVLAILLLRARQRARDVEGRLEAAAAALETLQRAFSRFAPAAVVEDIIARGVSTRSEKKDVTFLFADLKGFTPLAERLDPETLVRLLNGWFERMSGAVTAHRGHVAKLIGDGILALFGALEENPWQANDAVHAALAMRAALEEYNAGLRAGGMPALAMGVGIHRGTAVTGVIGSTELVEYGAIGSVVNLASRVEDLTRVHDVDILVTAATCQGLDRRFRLRRMPDAEVKGASGMLATFVVEGFEAGGG
jgi:class 3 adenylate cyclase